MEILESPFSWFIKAQLWNRTITNEDIEKVVIETIKENFSEEIANEKIKILNKLLYKWYTDPYIHDINISDDELKKISDITFSSLWKIPITSSVSLYANTILLVIESAIIAKQWGNEKKSRSN